MRRTTTKFLYDIPAEERRWDLHGTGDETSDVVVDAERRGTQRKPIEHHVDHKPVDRKGYGVQIIE